MVTAAWTFQSAGTDEQPPSLWVVRFAPRLDDHNRAPADRPMHLPVRVEPQAGTDVGELTSLTIEASFDDGATWRPVRLTGNGTERTAHLVNPADGFVSLRATAIDSHGNTVEETIIRAYALK